MPTDEAIILVGGLGTRLRALVSDVPKPLAPVAGRPFLAWVLDHLADHDIRHVVLAAGYMADHVARVVTRQWRGMTVDYSIEAAPLGTGGAVRQARALLRGDAAHVLNGDTFLRYRPAALEHAARLAGADLGMALAQVDDVARYGAVDCVGGQVRGFREKGRRGPGYINAGCYFLGAAALAALPADACYSFETAVLAPLTAAGRVCGYTDTDAFIDIGVPDDYQRAQRWFGGHAAQDGDGGAR